MCCLFGLIDYGGVFSTKTKEAIIRVLSSECEERGTDATGIAYLCENKMIIDKKPLPANKMKFKLKGNPKVIMGHTRMTTQGSEKINANNHPFMSQKLGFALAHNGVIYNDKELRKKEELPETDIETDSYIAVQLIDKKKSLDFDSLKFMTDKVQGSFCFTILDRNNELYIIKGDNPMAIAEFDGFYIYTSTKDILKRSLKKFKIEPKGYTIINQGDILKFKADGNIMKDTFEVNFYNYYCGFDYLSYRKNNTESENEYLMDLIHYAMFLGINEEAIIELYESGIPLEDIEDMLYDTELGIYDNDDEI